MPPFEDPDDGIEVFSDDDNTFHYSRSVDQENLKTRRQDSIDSLCNSGINNTKRSRDGISKNQKNLSNPNKRPEVGQVRQSRNDSGVSDVDVSDSINRFLNDVEKQSNKLQDDDILKELTKRMYISKKNDVRKVGPKVKEYALEYEIMADMLTDSRKQTKSRRPISLSSLPDNQNIGSKIEQRRAGSSGGRISPPEQYLLDGKETRQYIPSSTTTHSKGSKNCYHTKIYNCTCAKNHQQERRASSRASRPDGNRNCYHTTIYKCPCNGKRQSERMMKPTPNSKSFDENLRIIDGILADARSYRSLSDKLFITNPRSMRWI